MHFGSLGVYAHVPEANDESVEQSLHLGQHILGMGRFQPHSSPKGGSS